MGWTSNDEPQVKKKKGMETSSKILLGIIACVVLIIILIVIMLINIQMNSIVLAIDGKEIIDYDINEKLVTNIDGKTYINIEEFAKLTGYEYHKGEYKSFSNDEDKCYIKGKEETSTFYADDNKVNKLPIDSEIEEEYREIRLTYKTKMKNEIMYAPIETIKVAFNVDIAHTDKSMFIYTFDYLVNSCNINVTKWGYTSIDAQAFENQKAILYDRIIVKKEDGMYKIINSQNTQEIVPDKYSKIEFSESNQQFLVTNSLGKIGIINMDGDVQITPKYDSIALLDKKEKLYIVEQDKKFGIIKKGDVDVIAPKYDAIGSDVTSVEINGIKKDVNPVLKIDICKGIIVKKDKKYGVIDLEDNIIVPIEVENIYTLENDEKELEYFMIYNGEELNIVDMLIEQGIIKDPEEIIEEGNTIVPENNNIEQDENIVTTNSVTNTLSDNTLQ